MKPDACSLRSRNSLLACLLLGLAPVARGDSLPAADQRAAPPRTLNTLRSFPDIAARRDWQARAREIREHILVSCGLWPLPEKTPLNARIFGRIERDGYSVEKVYLQTYPGFYLAGNLYRPRGRGPGPFPGVLNPHGHWRHGRLEDARDGSIPARCISFARQGMVAFAYDMVGYNDTLQVSHKFAADPTNLLWNISLMGLQTWNSLRALDFLAALPDVDPKRLGCTGASGGGTQTFILGAVDDRLAAQAPCVMVSHSMQGGCLCENAPGLRVDYSNMEIAAVPAPRPQILVAATGDWTKATLTVEGPAIAGIYRLFRAEDRLRYVRFDFGHNYNQTTREAVYEWFGQWLLRHPNPSSLKEQPCSKEPDTDLLVWPDKKLPADALNEVELVESLVGLAGRQLAALKPKDLATLRRFKQAMLPVWRHGLQLEFPVERVLVERGATSPGADFTATRFDFGRAGKGDRLPASLLAPSKGRFSTVVVLAHPQGRRAFLGPAGEPTRLARQLLDRRCAVLLLDTFLTGDLARPEVAAARAHLKDFFSTYNRTDVQERLQDLLTACAFAREELKARRVVLCGVDRAGLWSLLAAPAADAVVADCAALELGTDAVLMGQDLFAPGLRRFGAFEGAATLAAPNPLLVHNTGPASSAGGLRDTYAALRRGGAFRQDTRALADADLADWLAANPTAASR